MRLDGMVCNNCKRYNANGGNCDPSEYIMAIGATHDCSEFKAIKEENNMKNLEGIEIRDKVWSPRYGWGIVQGIENDANYPIKVSFHVDDGKILDAYYDSFGKEYQVEVYPTLFFDIPDYKKGVYPKRPRWRAKQGEKYYYIGSTSEIRITREEKGDIDDKLFKVYNYFKTKEEAMKSKFYKVFHGHDEGNKEEK